jgi:hypothetical protein
MNKGSHFRTGFQFLKSVAAATGLALVIGIPCRAQQEPEVSLRYAQKALQALQIIEAAPSSDTRGQNAINVARSLGTTTEEQTFSTLLQNVYKLKLRDNDVVEAYTRVIEVEGFQDDADTKQIRDRKDYAASELTDTIAAIQSRQERCFRQLEASLNQRSLQNVLACSAWIANKPVRQLP